MAQAVQHAKFVRRAHGDRRYRAAQGPVRGIAVGLALSAILWLMALVAWLHVMS